MFHSAPRSPQRPPTQAGPARVMAPRLRVCRQPDQGGVSVLSLFDSPGTQNQYTASVYRMS